MGALRVILTILFILVCIVLSAIVLMQEGKSAGLGAISGMAETYWGKNKGRSMEGMLIKYTKYLAIAFMVLAVILNLLGPLFWTTEGTLRYRPEGAFLCAGLSIHRPADKIYENRSLYRQLYIEQQGRRRL